MLSRALWPEDTRRFDPQSTLGGIWEPRQCCRSPNLEDSSASPSTDIRDFDSERNVVQRHSTPDEPGAVF